MTRLFHPPFTAEPARLQYHGYAGKARARVLDARGHTVCELPWSGDPMFDTRRAEAIVNCLGFAYPVAPKCDAGPSRAPVPVTEN